MPCSALQNEKKAEAEAAVAIFQALKVRNSRDTRQCWCYSRPRGGNRPEAPGPVSGPAAVPVPGAGPYSKHCLLKLLRVIDLLRQNVNYYGIPETACCLLFS